MKKKAISLINYFIYRLKEKHLLLLYKLIGKKLQMEKENIVLQYEYGHYQSKKKQSAIDKFGNPLPWFTYPAIEYLNQFDLSELTVFEWGSGNSSLFFAARVKSIYSVESDQFWYESISKRKEQNQKVVLVDMENYTEHINTHEQKFDIIIVDGKKREECAKYAPSKLNKGGVIILDNSDWFKNTAKYLRNEGFIQVDMHGFGPINDYTWTTSFFLSREFNLRPIADVQPSYSIGAIKNSND